MPTLNWKLLTKRRAGLTHGLPPGKEETGIIVCLALVETAADERFHN